MSTSVATLVLSWLHQHERRSGLEKEVEHWLKAVAALRGISKYIVIFEFVLQEIGHEDVQVNDVNWRILRKQYYTMLKGNGCVIGLTVCRNLMQYCKDIIENVT